MARKYFTKSLSVGLSLALCASLVAPAFAASFSDLQAAVNGVAGEYANGEIVRDDNNKITLNADVDYQESDGTQTDIKINQNTNTNSGDITLDLNGHNITGKGNDTNSSVIWIQDGSLTLQDSEATTDREGNYTSGTISGAGNSAVWVNAGGTFNMDGGTLSGNTLNGNNGHPGATTGGGGVNVQGGTFNMTGGKITTNSSAHNGGGVNVHNGTFNMSGGEISGNTCFWGNAVSVIGDKASFTLSGNAALDGEVFVKLGGSVNADSDRSSLTGEYTTKPDDSAGTRLTSVALPAPVEDETTSPVITPTTPDPVDDPAIDEVIDIDDPAVPLAAGPVTCGEFVDYLWRHEGEPEADLVVEHEYAQAISWALSIGIIDEEEFEADELVTVFLVRDILTNFAEYADMVMPELTTLTGEDDEAVLNCGEVIAEFFGEELAA